MSALITALLHAAWMIAIACWLANLDIRVSRLERRRDEDEDLERVAAEVAAEMERFQ